MVFNVVNAGAAVAGGAVRYVEGLVQHVFRGKQKFSAGKTLQTGVTTIVSGLVAGFAPVDVGTSALTGYVGSRALTKAFVDSSNGKAK